MSGLKAVAEPNRETFIAKRELFRSISAVSKYFHRGQTDSEVAIGALGFE